MGRRVGLGLWARTEIWIVWGLALVEAEGPTMASARAAAAGRQAGAL